MLNLSENAMSEQDDHFDDMPRKLAEDLRGLFAREVRVPGEVERAILDSGRRRIGHRRRVVVIKRLAATVAAAAAVAAVYFLVVRNPEPIWKGEPVVASLAADVDGNGRVDILDAFLLARRIEAREALGEELDLNGDGVVDEKDVDAIAQRAVKL